MSRSPVAINDGGVFRYVDFVNYIPDFLKEEEDVVTLMQLFSDYINNAYRNTEVSHKFYFNYIATESVLGQVKERVNKFLEKMRASADNGLYVHYMSMPRTNANTNDTDKLSYISTSIYYDGERQEQLPINVITDIIPSFNKDDDVTKDGDVVYIEFANGEVYPYIINKHDNVLQIERERTSQDPFHYTLNESINGAPRIVKFLPKDVGALTVSRIGEIKSVPIYCIRFEMCIDDLKNESSHYLRHVGVDTIEMDVFNYFSSPNSTYTDYVSLTNAENKNIFEWKDDMPRGIFHFRELDDYVNGENADIYSEWSITNVDILNDGITCYLTLNTSTNLFVGDVIKIESSEIIGYSDGYAHDLSGTYTVSMVSGNVLMIRLQNRKPSGIQFDKPVSKRMTQYNRLYRYSMMYSRKEYDYTNIIPKLEWDNVIGTQSIEHRSVLYPFDKQVNTYIGELSFSDIYDYTISTDIQTGVVTYKNAISKYIKIPTTIELNRYETIYLEFNQTTEIVPSTVKSWLSDNVENLKTPIYANDVSGNKYYFKSRLTDGALKFTPVTMESSDAKLIRFKVYKVTSGIGTILTDTDSNNDVTVYSSRIPQVGDVCLVDKLYDDTTNDKYSQSETMNSLFKIVTVTPVNDKGFYNIVFDNELDYISSTDESTVLLTYLDRADETSRAIVGEEIYSTYLYCDEVFGDVYTHDYWMDANKTFALECCYKNECGEKLTIYRYDERNSYRIGNVIYFEDEGTLYKAVSNIAALDAEDSSPIASGKVLPYMFNVAKIGEKVVYNDYMYGVYKIATLDYGERIDLASHDKYTELLNTVFIEKADNNALIYGWKDREYLLNEDYYNVSGKARNGFAEFYSTGVGNDLVLSNAEYFSVATTVPNEGVITKNINNYDTITNSKDDDDWTLWAERQDNGQFKVFVHINNHGFVDNSKVIVYGAGNFSGFDFDTPEGEFDYITVVNKNEFYFIRNSDCDEDYVQSSKWGVQITCVRDIYNPIVSVAYYYDDYEKFEGGYLYITTQYPHGYSVYTKVTTKNVPTTPTNLNWVDKVLGEKHSINKIVDEYTYAIMLDEVFVPIRRSDERFIKYSTGYGATNQLKNAYSIVSPEEGDVIKVDNKYYKVKTDDWTVLSGDTIEVPFYLYTHQNIMDTTTTNPSTGYGEDIEIEDIRLLDDSTVQVITRGAMKLTAGKSSVYIRNVHPVAYNGRYVVDEVFTDRMFSFKIEPGSVSEAIGRHVNNGIMTANECKFYRYLISEVDISRKSVYEIFKYGLKIVDNYSSTPIENLVVTEEEHGYEVGDNIVLYSDGEYVNATVEVVVSKCSFRYQNAKKKNYSGGFVFKGVYIPENNHKDNIVVGGLYTQYLNCIDRDYEFCEGDIVFANDQLATDMPMTYIVESGNWKVCGKKRVMKIRKLDVDRYKNDEWLTASTDEDIDEYVYHTYSYPEIEEMIAEDLDNGIHSYIMPFHVRNYTFRNPYIEHIDSTRPAEYQFNSKHDYASIAPRYDFEDKSFKGIPDMKYPLIEKIERLIYLRDANVIDFDLIGYLARFMGYDITDAKVDIDSSMMYSTTEMKEKAVRETVSNLPQYYTLGGTKAGLEMLLNTFGIVADVITMWTNLDRPYKELIEEGKLRYRQDYDYENGIQSHWAPTPHIRVRISTGKNFKNMFVDDESFTTLIKNIKVFKPIQVVFDEFIKYVETEPGKLYITDVSCVNSGKMNINVNYNIDTFSDDTVCY